MSGVIQKVFSFFKPVIPHTKATTYTLKFIYQMSPLGLIAVFYYSYLEGLDSNNPYLLKLYDL